jgi:hypothetical protein
MRNKTARELEQRIRLTHPSVYPIFGVEAVDGVHLRST